jgi:hypothetical protein
MLYVIIYFKILKLSDWKKFFYLILGTLSAFGNGFAYPYLAFLITRIVDVFLFPTSYTFRKNADDIALQFVFIGICTFILKILQTYFFVHVAEGLT